MPVTIAIPFDIAEFTNSPVRIGMSQPGGTVPRHLTGKTAGVPAPRRFRTNRQANSVALISLMGRAPVLPFRDNREPLCSKFAGGESPKAGLAEGVTLMIAARSNG
ncbi:hypothetical protein [Bosea sp. NPDC055594]